MALIDRIKNDFEKGGFKVQKDSFGDNSASWLTIKDKNNKDFEFCILFNYKGTQIENLEMFRREYRNVITYFKD